MKNAPVRHAFEYALLSGIEGLFRALPHGAARRLGASLGELAFHLDRRHRRVTRRNFALAFPDLSDAERTALTRDCFRHFGTIFGDGLSIQRFDRAALCQRLTVSGWEHLDAAMAGGRGVLVMGAHLGNWEVVALAIGALHGPIQALGRAADNPYVDRKLQALRTRFGNGSLDKYGSVRRMVRLLRDGERVGILIDQRVRPRQGILVPFFGRPAWTSPLLAKLALRTGAWIVPTFADHLPGGRYALTFEPPIVPLGHDDEATVAALTARCLAAVEAAIRRTPAHWLWMHERWKDA